MYGGSFLPHIFGSLIGLASQFFDFTGNYGKAFARFTGPRSLDGRVQCQQIGLFGNIHYHLGDLTNGLGGATELTHPI